MSRNWRDHLFSTLSCLSFRLKFGLKRKNNKSNFLIYHKTKEILAHDNFAETKNDFKTQKSCGYHQPTKCLKHTVVFAPLMRSTSAAFVSVIFAKVNDTITQFVSTAAFHQKSSHPFHETNKITHYIQ